jgi:hypothetical protein
VQFGSAITYLYEMAPTGRKGLTASLGQVAVSPGMILGILMCQAVLYGCTPGKGVRVGAKSESDARGLDVCLKGMYRAGVEFWAAVGGSHNQYYAVEVPPKAMFGRWPKLAHKYQASQRGCSVLLHTWFWLLMLLPCCAVLSCTAEQLLLWGWRVPFLVGWILR